MTTEDSQTINDEGDNIYTGSSGCSFASGSWWGFWEEKWHFTDDIFNCIFLEGNVFVSNLILLKCVLQMYTWQKVGIDSDLVLSRPQTITRTNNDHFTVANVHNVLRQLYKLIHVSLKQNSGNHANDNLISIIWNINMWILTNFH